MTLLPTAAPPTNCARLLRTSTKYRNSNTFRLFTPSEDRLERLRLEQCVREQGRSSEQSSNPPRQSPVGVLCRQLASFAAALRTNNMTLSHDLVYPPSCPRSNNDASSETCQIISKVAVMCMRCLCLCLCVRDS